MNEYYLAFYQNKNRYNPFSRIIEYVEKRPHSHVEIVNSFNGSFEDSHSWGSTFPKSRKIPLSEMKKHYYIERLVPLRTVIPDSSCDAILDGLCGNPYSFLQVILTGIKIIAKGSVSWIKTAKPNLSKYLICTELAGIFMQEACGYRYEISPECLSLEEIELIALKNLLEKP